MARTLTEKKVLKKLGIPDFRHMTKDKIVAFASMLPQMDPEVAKKALEQFPEYAKNVLEIVGIYKEELDELVNANNESIKNVYEGYKFILNKIAAELEQPELTFEQKDAINERLIQVADKMAEADANNKLFILKMGAEILGGLVIFGGMVYAAIGGTVNFNNPNSSDQNYLDNNSNSDDQYLS